MDTLTIPSPFGPLLLTLEDGFLTGLSFCDNPPKNRKSPQSGVSEKNRIAAECTVRWLTLYFQGTDPDVSVPMRPTGTPFQKKVWAFLSEVPFGSVLTYGELAERIAARESVSSPSPRAVGQALGKNPILLLLPCHRIVPKSGGVGGYAAGSARKQALLSLEGHLF